VSPSERERLARLEKRLEEVENRLSHLEGEPVLEAEMVSVKPPPAPVELLQPVPPSSAAPPAHEPPQFETRMGLTWINRLGAVTLVLGAAFFFNYAVEAGWLGPAVRVLLGVTVGSAALILADRFWRGQQRVFAQGLCGAGVAILYLSFWASWRLYHVVPYTPAFLLMVLTTAAAAALSIRYASEAIAALGFFGGYATPLLLYAGEDRPWFLLAYLLLIGLGALYVARGRRWRWVQTVAFAATATIYVMSFRQRPERHVVNTVSALAYYALFAWLEPELIIYAAQILTPLAPAAIWAPSLWTFAVLTLTVAIAGLAITRWRGLPAGGVFSLAGFWLSYLSWNWQTPAPGSPWAVFVFLTIGFLLFTAWPRVVPLRSADLLQVSANGLFYFGCSYFDLERGNHAWLGLFALLLAVVYMYAGRRLWTRDQRGAQMYAGFAWVFLALAVPVQFTGYRITIGWAIEAATLAWIGRRVAQPRANQGSLALSALVLLRLLTVDTWMYASPANYSALLNGRFVAFAASAVCLWASARWVAKGWPAMAALLAGHFVILWGLALETSGWAARNAAPKELRSVESTAISILLALYAVLLVGIGVGLGSAVHRVLGLSLIAVVVAKLYLYDVWFLSLFYRMAAFAALGALLLAMSYLYSRSRERAATRSPDPR
jgi:hypothetical protein